MGSAARSSKHRERFSPPCPAAASSPAASFIAGAVQLTAPPRGLTAFDGSIMQVLTL
jgi:hypothetical protein